MNSRQFRGGGLVLGVLILVVSILLVYRSTKSTHRFYLKQVERSFSGMQSGPTELIDEKDLVGLPVLVRNYLEYVGVVGTEKVRHFSVSLDGEFRMSPARDWAPVMVQQMSFMENPTRLFFMVLKFMGMKIFGLHHYESATASMVIRALDLFTVADARGPEMNKGETVTVFNDMCVLAPSTLIDHRISWKEIDGETVEGTFTNEGISVTATLYFNEYGQLINFISDDRYYLNEDGTYDLVRWSTPVSDYKEINGLNLPGYGEAVWNMADGPFSYARFNIRDVKINPEER